MKKQKKLGRGISEDFVKNQQCFVTCEDIVGVELHVHPVLLCYVSHDPLGAAVLLRGQQPTQ